MMHWNWLKIGLWDPQTAPYSNAVYLVSWTPSDLTLKFVIATRGPPRLNTHLKLGTLFMRTKAALERSIIAQRIEKKTSTEKRASGTITSQLHVPLLLVTFRAWPNPSLAIF